MSKKANLTVIGAFVVGAVALVVIGLLIFGTGRFFKSRTKYVLFFEGSVKGLIVGAPVDFRGVKIGSVTDIKVSFDRKDLSMKIPVIIEIEPERIAQTHTEGNDKKVMEEQGTKEVVDYLINQGLRAQLGMQSLVTGQLYVLLDFFPDRPLKLVGAEPGYPEIPTVPSSLEKILETIEKLPLDEIVNKVRLALEGIAEFFNSPELRETISSLNQTIKSVQSLIQNVDNQVTPLASDLGGTVKDVQKLVRDMDGQVKPLASALGDAAKEIQKLLKTVEGRIPTVTATLENTFKAAEGAVKQAEKTLRTVDELASEHGDVPYELAKALKELSGAARSLRVVADYLERHPEALIRGKDKGK